MSRTMNLIAALALSGTALGTQITVNPNGGGNYTDLQAAIDAAQPGDVILVVGGCYREIVIDKPLSIVGSAKIVRTTASCTSVFQGSGIFDDCDDACPAVVIAPSAGAVTFAGITIQGQYSAFLDGTAQPTIFSSPGVDLSFFDCTITGPTSFETDGVAANTSAAIQAPNATVTLVRTTVSGGSHVFDIVGSGAIAQVLAFDGPPGILAGTVTMLDSTVVGGSQGEWSIDGSGTGCPAPWAPGIQPSFGRGGAGIVADKVYRAGGSLAGGLGATITNSCSPPTTVHNQQPSGVDCDCVQYVVLPNDLASSGQIHIGSPWSATAAGSGGLLLLGTPMPQPLNAPPYGLLFVLPPTSLAPIPGNSIGAVVPSNPQLIGLQIGVQWLSPSGALSRPVFEIVRP